MVAVAAPAGMPSRQFSAAIVGAVWPHTDPSSCQTLSEAQHEKGVELLNCADTVRTKATAVASEQSGSAIDGFCDMCHRLSSTYTDQADHYFAMSRVSEEVGRLLYGLREDLDQIDSEAHAAIEKIMEQVELGYASLAGVKIMEIIAAARAAAMAKSAEVTAAVAAKGAQLAISGSTGTRPVGSYGVTGDPVDPKLRELASRWGLGGGRGVEGIPTGRIPGGAPPDSRLPGDKPGETPAPGDQRGGQDGGYAPDGSPADKADGKGDPGSHGTQAGEGGPGDAKSPSDARSDTLSPKDGAPTATTLPVSNGGGGSPSISSLGSPSGLGTSFTKMPSTPSGLGGGGLPTQGLGSPGGLGSAGLPGGAGAAPAMPAPPAASSDFSRGLSAGLGGGGPAAPFAPPVPPPASTALGSAAPSGAASSGPAPVAAAAGPAASSSPAAPLAAAAGSSAASVGTGGVPSTPMGPLPPFGSDVPRTAAPAAAVTPAAGPAAPAPAATGGGSAAGPAAPLPPGVLGSGVGASAGAASEGIRSSLPDPLLTSASQLLYQLLHDSRMYPYMDWCVGVFRTSSGIETLIVNSEGAGYIPTGVFVPRSARMLFADGGLSPEFRARWFSWANPAETMIAYAQLAAEHREDIELWALAVSTDDGGTSIPARSMIQHYEECSRSQSPISDDAPTSQLDDTHMHRLETLDRALYARLTGFGDGPLPDRSEAWRTTVAAAQMALGRAGSIPNLAVSPAIRTVLDLLSKGLPVPANRWQELVAAHIGVLMSGAGLRPGRLGNDAATVAYALAYHDLARLIELLLLWRLDSIKYPEIAYLAGQISLTPRLVGAS